MNQNRFSPASFGLHGFVPAGYALFAFALGATVGLLVRRTLPAMARDPGRVHRGPPGRGRMDPATFHEPGHRVRSAHAGRGRVRGGGAGVAPCSWWPNAPNLPNALVSNATVANAAGQAPTSAIVRTTCPDLQQGLAGAQQGTSSGGGPFGGHSSVQSTTQQAQDVFTQCIDRLSAKYHVLVTYQPASRFWTFQTMETALFVILSVLLAGGCAWWIRHRVR